MSTKPVVKKTENMTQDELLLHVIRLLKDHQRDALAELLDELQPYDIAQLYAELPDKHRSRFLNMLDSRSLALLLQELERPLQLEALQKMEPGKFSQALNLMDNDDLADLLGEMTSERKDELLGMMRQEESSGVQNLLKYSPETAGGIMTDRYVWIRRYYTVREAVEKLKNFAEIAENLYYLYVLDEQKVLVGVVSYRDLLLADPGDRIEDIMYSRVISVPVHMDQEQVARTIERYDFLSVPVVDDDGRLVGIVTVDDVVDVLIQEAAEDIGKLAATGKTIDFHTGAIQAALTRLPWLVLLLFLGIMSGNIISQFEDTLHKVVALAYFMPMIAGMTGNTGTQSLAVVVRGLMTQRVNRGTVIRLLRREAGVGFIIGCVCGVLITVIVALWQQHLMLGIVVGVSLFLTLLIGTLAGTVIPLILYRFRVDPAIASGPLITTLNDMFSITVYFGTATLFLSNIMPG